jgi:hypothetical protein
MSDWKAALEAERRKRGMPDPTPPARMTLREIARAANLTRKAVQHHVNTGRLSAERASAWRCKWRWEVEEAEARAFIAEYRKEAA